MESESETWNDLFAIHIRIRISSPDFHMYRYVLARRPPATCNILKSQVGVGGVLFFKILVGYSVSGLAGFRVAPRVKLVKP